MFSKPPMNKIFGSGEPAPSKPMPSSNEGVSESQIERSKSSVAWKKFLTLFILGVMSVEAVEAASMSMSMEEKKDAIEYMKSSPEIVRDYEQQLIKQAESVKAEEEGMVDGEHLTKKVFSLDKRNITKVYIEYSNGKAVSLNIRELNADGGKTIISDGYRDQNSGIRQKMDGYVDNIVTKDAAGNVIQKISFVELKAPKGEGPVTFQIKGVAGLSEGGASKLFYDTQKGLHDTLQAVVENPLN